MRGRGGEVKERGGKREREEAIRIEEDWEKDGKGEKMGRKVGKGKEGGERRRKGGGANRGRRGCR